MPKDIFYGAAVFLLIWVWWYYKALVYRAGIIEHLKTKHPDLYAKVMVDYSGMRLLDRLIADNDLVMRQAKQEAGLLKVSSGGDPELDRLRTRYRRAVVAMVCMVVVFLLGTFLIAVLAKRPS